MTKTPSADLEVMGQAGRQYALDHFTTNSLLPKVIEIIENAIQEGIR